ncbi:MAG: hypothetical protein Ct9H300mP21_09100 [Pseudomonadota bacterium]|nr:MAG: hypothetical protein Ct9H300mP21_09100 [Pseudomonadota bacterium]
MRKLLSKHLPTLPVHIGLDAIPKFLLEEARDNLANSLGVKSQEILFTSGGTESNNTVLGQLLMIPENSI